MATNQQRQSLSRRAGIGSDSGAQARAAYISRDNAATNAAGGHVGNSNRGHPAHHPQVLDSTDNQQECHEFYSVTEERVVVYAWLTRSRCPSCGTLDTERYASDGRTQYRRCKKCEAHYKQIGEIV